MYADSQTVSGGMCKGRTPVRIIEAAQSPSDILRSHLRLLPHRFCVVKLEGRELLLRRHSTRRGELDS
jgi:hypothetical protein